MVKKVRTVRFIFMFLIIALAACGNKGPLEPAPAPEPSRTAV